MDNLIIPIILSLFYFLPTILIMKKWFSNEPWWRKLILGLIIATIFIPLAIFYANHFGGITFNLANCIRIIGAINVIVIIALKFIPNNPAQRVKIKQYQHWVYQAAIILALFVFSYPYIVNHQPIIGGDSPHYLKNSQKLITNGYPDIVFDRSIIYFLPAIMSLITGMSVELALKLIVTAYEVGSIVILISLAEKFLAPKLLPPFAITTIFSLAIFNLSKQVIPFFMALALTYFLIDHLIASKKYFINQRIIPFVWGALFNLHGVIAFASLGLILPVVIYQAWYYKTPSKKFVLWLIIFLACSQPLFTSHWARVSAGVITPIKSVFWVSPPSDKSNQNLEDQWVEEFTTNRTLPLSQFPTYKGSFTSTYSLMVLVLAAIGIFMHIRRYKDPRFFALIAITLGQCALTQQEFLGMNWFAVRFVFAMFPCLYIWAFLSFKKLNHHPTTSSLAFYLAVALITLPTVFSSLPKITSASASISPLEYNFIKAMSQHVKDNDIIFVGASNSQWIQGLIPNTRVFDTHPDAICNDESGLMRMTAQMWDVGQAFSRNTLLTQSIDIFQKYSQGQSYYIYIDAANYHCINGDLFPANLYAQVAREGDLYVLKYR